MNVKSCQTLTERGTCGVFIDISFLVTANPVVTDTSQEVEFYIPGASKYLRKWVQVPVVIGPCPIF